MKCYYRLPLGFGANLERMEQLEDLFEVLSGSAEVGLWYLFWLLVFHIAVVFLFLREQAGEAYVAIVLLIKHFFTVPIYHLHKLLKATVDYGRQDRAETLSTHERSSLLRVWLAAIRVMVALGLVWVASAGIYNSLAAMAPDSYHAERRDRLKELLTEAKSGHKETKKEMKAYEKEFPPPEGDPPELLVVAEANEQAAAAHETAKATRALKREEYYAAQAELKNTSVPQLRYYRYRLVRQVDRTNGGDADSRQELRSSLDELCEGSLAETSCAEVNALFAAWEAHWLAIGVQDQAGEAHARAAEAHAVVVERLQAIENRRQELSNQYSYLEQRIDELKVDLKDAKSKASLQIGKSLFAFATHFFLFIVMIWVVGLATELFLLGFRWIDDIAEIRKALATQANPGSAPVDRGPPPESQES